MGDHAAPLIRSSWRFWRCSMRVCLRMGNCLQAVMGRKPFPASNIPSAVQRGAILASRQCFTSRQTCRMPPFMDAMMLVLARERRNSRGRPSPTTVRLSSGSFRIDPDTLDTLDVRGIFLVLPCPVRVTGNRGRRIVARWGDPRNTADRPDPKGGAVLVNESNHLRNGRSNSAPLPGSICLHVREEGQNKPAPSSGYHWLGAVP